mgnify:CR=1 FL=1
MYIYSVIPARGGSKGIVDKNLRLIGGVPLVGRSVIASTGSSKITETFVSSDSEAILEIGSIYGASSLKRPTKFAMDKSSTDEVLMHFVSYLEVNKKEPDIIVFLQCTSPFTSSKDVNKVLDTLINNPDIDCAFSANIDHSFLWFKKDKNKAVGLNPLHGLWRHALWFDSKNKHHATAFRRGLSGYSQIGGIHYVGHSLRHRAHCGS